jgi:ribosomal protein S27AE
MIQYKPQTPAWKLEANRRWRARNRVYLREYWGQWRRARREAMRAHRRLDYALRTGKITRPKKCDRCGKRCIPDGHHEDYSRPLDVRWLCKRCHAQERKTERSRRR